MGEKFSPSSEGPGRWVKMTPEERAQVYGNIHEDAAKKIDADGYNSIPQADFNTLAEANGGETTVETSKNTVSQTIFDAFQAQYPEDADKAHEIMRYAVGYLRTAPENVALGVGNIDNIGKQDKITIYKDGSDAERWKVKVEKPDGETRFDGYLFPLGAEQQAYLDGAPATYEEALQSFEENPNKGTLRGSIDGLLDQANELKVRDRVVESLKLNGPIYGQIPREGEEIQKRWALTCDGTNTEVEIADTAGLKLTKTALFDAITTDNGEDGSDDKVTEYITALNTALGEIQNEELKKQTLDDIATDLPYEGANGDYSQKWTVSLIAGEIHARPEATPNLAAVYTAKENLTSGSYENAAAMQLDIVELQTALNAIPAGEERTAAIQEFGLNEPLTITGTNEANYVVTLTQESAEANCSIAVEVNMESLTAAAQGQLGIFETQLILLNDEAIPRYDFSTLNALINEAGENKETLLNSLGFTDSKKQTESTTTGLPYTLSYNDEAGVSVELNQEKLGEMASEANTNLLLILKKLDPFPEPRERSTEIDVTALPETAQTAITAIKDLIEKTPAANLEAIWQPYRSLQIATQDNYEESLQFTINPNNKEVHIYRETKEYKQTRETLKTLIDAMVAGNATPENVAALQTILQDREKNSSTETLILTYFSPREPYNILEIGEGDSKIIIKLADDYVVRTEPEITEPVTEEDPGEDHDEDEIVEPSIATKAAPVQEALTTLNSAALSENGTTNNSLSDLEAEFKALQSALDAVEESDKNAVLKYLGINGHKLTIVINGTHFFNFSLNIDETGDVGLLPDEELWKSQLTVNYEIICEDIKNQKDLSTQPNTDLLETTLRLIDELGLNKTERQPYLAGINFTDLNSTEITQTNGIKRRLTLITNNADWQYKQEGEYPHIHIETIPDNPYINGDEIPIGDSISFEEAQSLELVENDGKNNLMPKDPSQFQWMNCVGKGWRLIRIATPTATE